MRYFTLAAAVAIMALGGYVESLGAVPMAVALYAMSAVLFITAFNIN